MSRQYQLSWTPDWTTGLVTWKIEDANLTVLFSGEFTMDEYIRSTGDGLRVSIDVGFAAVEASGIEMWDQLAPGLAEAWA